jgi:eukaryotic-like serine/threonine-protein kinase
LNTGTILAGRYRIERVLGRGAMGVVIEALDQVLKRKVALKLILPAHASDGRLRGRFIREAESMARLRSEHVAKVFEVGQLDDGSLFLAMEYLEGESLEQRVAARGPVPVNEAVEIVLDALDAVAEAHAIGLVHRDLKPANLFLSREHGRDRPLVKVLDFGIVKDMTSGARITAAGTLPGTPAYMAPEQVALEEAAIDSRADVWAIGVTMYEILSGELPFAGPIHAMLAKIRTEAPPRLRAKRPDVGLELEKVITRCMAKRPGDRYASAAELAAALRDLRSKGLLRSAIDARSDATTEIRRPFRKTLETMRERTPGSTALWILLGAVVVALLAGFVLAMQGRLSRARFLRSQTVQPYVRAA